MDEHGEEIQEEIIIEEDRNSKDGNNFQKILEKDIK